MKEIFVVGDIILDTFDGYKAVVLAVDRNYIWTLDDHGLCETWSSTTDYWKKVGHTKMVGTLLNVLKEG